MPQWEYCEKSLIGNGGSHSCGFLSHADSPARWWCWRTEILSHGGDVNEILYSTDEKLLENIWTDYKNDDRDDNRRTAVEDLIIFGDTAVLLCEISCIQEP